MSRELLKRAAEYIKDLTVEIGGFDPLVVEIEAELAKPEPGPVAWLSKYKADGSLEICTPREPECDQWYAGFPVYAKPPRQQEPLSKPYPLSFYHGSTGDYINGFEDGVAWAEDQHGIGGGE